MSLDVFYSYCVFVVHLQLVIGLIMFPSTFLGLLLGPPNVFQRLGGLCTMADMLGSKPCVVGLQ